jgi:hypothetical protein
MKLKVSVAMNVLLAAFITVLLIQNLKLQLNQAHTKPGLPRKDEIFVLHEALARMTPPEEATCFPPKFDHHLEPLDPSWLTR